MKILNSVTSPTPAIGDNSSNVATTQFVTGKVAAAGGGDMIKSVYDTNSNGTVDNAEKLGGNLPSVFATSASVKSQSNLTVNVINCS